MPSSLTRRAYRFRRLSSALWRWYLLSILKVFRRSGVELPAVFVALRDLRLALQLLIVVVLHADRLPDIVDDILIRCRIVAARRFVAYCRGRFPVRIDVASGQCRARLVVLVEALEHLATTATCG